MTTDVLDLGRPSGLDKTVSAYGAPTADPGATASTRRLTLAVLGVSDAVPLATLNDALRASVHAARAAGCGQAAAAFESAQRYLARALEPPSPRAADSGRAMQPSRQLLLATAVRHVRRAYALLQQEQITNPRPPDGPPDPAFIERPAALIDDLRDLCVWSGLTAPAITAAARRCGLLVDEAQIRATLEDRRFPTAAATEAIARGCGLPEQQCCAWLAARHRAARILLPSPPTGSRVFDPVLAAHATLDPRDAQTPAQFSVLLAEVRLRFGLSYGQVHAAAKRAGCEASWSRLWTIGSHYSFPTARVLEAFLAGCGMGPDERAPWLDARRRLASKRSRVRRTTARSSATRSGTPADGITANGTAAARLPQPMAQWRGTLPPDPRHARTWAQFSALLRLLVRWSGRDLTTIAQRALAEGVPVTREALHYTLAHGTLPGANTLNAFTVGCGLPPCERLRWLIARARLAGLSADSQRLPPSAMAVGSPRGHALTRSSA